MTIIDSVINTTLGRLVPLAYYVEPRGVYINKLYIFITSAFNLAQSSHQIVKVMGLYSSSRC